MANELTEFYSSNSKLLRLRARIHKITNGCFNTIELVSTHCSIDMTAIEIKWKLPEGLVEYDQKDLDFVAKGLSQNEQLLKMFLAKRLKKKRVMEITFTLAQNAQE